MLYQWGGATTSDGERYYTLHFPWCAACGIVIASGPLRALSDLLGGKPPCLCYETQALPAGWSYPCASFPLPKLTGTMCAAAGMLSLALPQMLLPRLNLKGALPTHVADEGVEQGETAKKKKKNRKRDVYLPCVLL